jgi:hypothetical protein
MQTSLSRAGNAPGAACTLVWTAFSVSGDSKPASTARITQRRAALQNACRHEAPQKR